MLAVPTKRTTKLDLAKPLRKYIEANYPDGKNEAKKHEAALAQLAEMRVVAAAARQPKPAGMAALAAYYKQMASLGNRFPIDDERGVKMAFCWQDCFKPQKKITQYSVAFERACVLFNLAALESQAGMGQDRGQPAGVKASANHFLRAASLFAAIRDDKTGLGGTRTSDLSREGLGMVVNLMLAQAQACYYEKAVAGKMKPAILAKLAKQAEEFYAAAYNSARTSVLATVLDKAWPAHIGFQQACFAASAHYQASKGEFAVADAKGAGYGAHIARLGAALASCESALASARASKLSAAVTAGCSALRDKVARERNSAIADNNSIYLEQIPAASSLPAIGKAAMAKLQPSSKFFGPGAEFAPAENAQDVLRALVPVSITRACAMYESRVSALVKRSGDQVKEYAENVRKRLADAGLPASVEGAEHCEGLPDAVWAKVERVQQAGGPAASIESALAATAEIGVQVKAQLDEARRTLAEEETQDASARSRLGQEYAMVATSASLNRAFREDLDRYSGLLAQAQQSDGVIRQKVADAGPAFARVAQPRARLDADIPASGSGFPPAAEAVRQALSQQMVGLGMLVQRLEALQGQLAQVAAGDQLDGISEKDASDEGLLPGLLQARCDSKYEKLETRIAETLAEVMPMIDMVMAKNDEFVAAKAGGTTDPATLARTQAIDLINSGVNAFDEVTAHVSEGATFYRDLLGRAEQLREACADHCLARGMERQDRLAMHGLGEERARQLSGDAAYAQRLQQEQQQARAAAANATSSQMTSDAEFARRLATQGSEGALTGAPAGAAAAAVVPPGPPAGAAPAYAQPPPYGAPPAYNQPAAPPAGGGAIRQGYAPAAPAAPAAPPAYGYPGMQQAAPAAPGYAPAAPMAPGVAVGAVVAPPAGGGGYGAVPAAPPAYGQAPPTYGQAAPPAYGAPPASTVPVYGSPPPSAGSRAAQMESDAEMARRLQEQMNMGN